MALVSAMGFAHATAVEAPPSFELGSQRAADAPHADLGPDLHLGIDPSLLPREATPLTHELQARGHNPCYMPDAGFGRYSSWLRIGGGAQMLIPLRGGHTADWGYDVVIHFHGHDAVRSPFVQAARGAVLVGIDLAVVSGPYTQAFEDRDAFSRLLTNVTRGLRRVSGRYQAHVRHLALSSWSAGFGAVTKILARHLDAVDGVVLLDSLHSDYVPRAAGDPPGVRRVQTPQLEPVLAMAGRAVHRDGILFVSHSEIVPPGYASTTEVANYLIEQVAGVRSAGEGANLLGARLLTRFDRQGMHVRGYQGGDKFAHCAHVGLLAEAVRDYLEPAWGTPEAQEPGDRGGGDRDRDRGGGDRGDTLDSQLEPFNP
jgi:hypothetical protein